MSINQILKERTSTMQTSAIRDYLEERVDLRTGKMVLDHTDFEWSGELMPVSIHHVYNSALSDVFYTRAADERIADFSGMKLGYGWRLNIMQSMMPASVTYEGETYNGFTYVDGDGNVTEFIPADNVNEFKAVNDDEAIYNSSSGVLTLGGYAYTFTSGRLTKIKRTDTANAVEQNINYTNGRITSVTDGAGRSFEFNYGGNGFLTSIVAPDNTAIEYEYDNYGVNNCLSNIYFNPNADDETPSLESRVSFIANSSTKLISSLAVHNVVGYETLSRDYAFNSTAKITSVSEYYYDNNSNATLDRTVYYAFSTNHTEVTVTEQNDGSDDMSEAISTVYAFDGDGNVISSHVLFHRDAEMLEHRGGTTPFNPYCTNEAFSSGFSQNLIMNPCFVISDTPHWKSTDVDMDIIDYYVRSDDDYAPYGKRALHITSNDETMWEDGYYQEIPSLPAGTYTFSAFVKIWSRFRLTDTADGSLYPGVYLSVIAGSDAYVSETVSETHEGFARLGVTFTLEEESDVTVLMLSNGAGRAYISVPQLERAPWYNEPNLLQNSDFTWQGGYEMSNNTAHRQYTDGFTTPDCVSIEPTGYIKQTYYPKAEASTLEGFVFSVYSRKADTYLNGASFSLKAVIHYSDNTSETISESIVPTNVWSKGELYFAKSKFLGVTSIDLICEVDNGTTTFYVDNMSLVRTSIETGLTAEDFEDNTEEAVEEYSETENETYVTTTDGFGNVLTEATIGGTGVGTLYRRFTYSSDGNNRTSETDNRGNTTSYTVDGASSRITSVTDRLGYVTEYTYDEKGKVISAVRKNGAQTVASVDYEYDVNGNLCDIYVNGTTEPLYSFRYNNIGSLVNANDMVEYDYRVNTGRLKKLTYANGWTAKLSYDRFGRINGETWYQGTSKKQAYEYAYDMSGNLARSIDKTANKDYTYSYQDGNLVRITECDIILTNDGEVISRVPVNTICYVYGNDGSLEKKVYSKAELTAEYSSTDNTSTVTHTAPILNEYDEVEVAEVDTVTTTTDALGRIANEQVVHNGTTVISKSLTYHEGNTTDYTNGNPTTTLVKKITEGNRSLEYTYDAEERITSCIDSRGFNDTYVYDDKGQLIQETRNGAVTKYEYDGYGNLTAKGCVFNADGTINRSSRENLIIGYDRDRIDYFIKPGLAVVFYYDDAGNPTYYKDYNLVWEKGRQLKQYGKHHFEYNANGIRTARYFDTDVDGETVQVRYDYELEGSKVVRMLYRDRLGAENILVPLYDSADSPIGIIYNNVPYWFVKNLQGDVLALKDDEGFEMVRYVYDAWGNVTVQRDRSGVDLADINPFRYRGCLYDYEFGLYYLQSRYYDPELCRFVNADEPVLVGAGNSIIPNLYAYCDNDSVNNMDPTGLLTVSRTWLALGLDVVFSLLIPYFSGPLDIFGRLLSWYAKMKKFTLLWDKLIYGVVPKFKLLYSKFFTLIRTAIWRVTGQIIANTTTTTIGLKLTEFLKLFENETGDKIIDFISCFFSAGSMIAGLLDFGDGKFDERCVLW